LQPEGSRAANRRATLDKSEGRRGFSEAGVEFKEVMRKSREESSVIFEIGENDPRWGNVAALMASLGGKDRRAFIDSNDRVVGAKAVFRSCASALVR